MSLIRIRRRRKREWIDVKKGASTTRLGVLFVAVVIVIWYLTVGF